MTELQKQQVCALRQAGRSFTDIAVAAQLPVGTVKTYCSRNKIHLSDVQSAQKTTHCLHCGAAIEQAAKRKPRKFCCAKCRDAWWNKNRLSLQSGETVTVCCGYCGENFRKPKGSRQKFCCHQHYIFSRFGVPS